MLKLIVELRSISHKILLLLGLIVERVIKAEFYMRKKKYIYIYINVKPNSLIESFFGKK